MLSSAEIRGMTLEEFAIRYAQTRINVEAETITGLVLQEQYIKNRNILVYHLDGLPELYHVQLAEALRKRLSVSSIYLDRSRPVVSLIVDWSL
jgi:hypothetical protein